MVTPINRNSSGEKVRCARVGAQTCDANFFHKITISSAIGLWQGERGAPLSNAAPIRTFFRQASKSMTCRKSLFSAQRGALSSAGKSFRYVRNNSWREATIPETSRTLEDKESSWKQFCKFWTTTRLASDERKTVLKAKPFALGSISLNYPENRARQFN